MLVAYAIPNRGCSNFREGLPYGDYDRPTPAPDSYDAWINRAGQASRRHPGRGRAGARRRAGRLLRRRPAPRRSRRGDRAVAAGQYVYIDAGHPSWLPSGDVAQRLLRSGVDRAEGVSLNVSNRYPTWAVADFGEELSELVGGRDYLIDTSRNGAAGTELDPASLANDWCNRPTRRWASSASGRPTRSAGRTLAAQLWIKPRASRTATPPSSRTGLPRRDRASRACSPARQARELILNVPDAARSGATRGPRGGPVPRMTAVLIVRKALVGRARGRADGFVQCSGRSTSTLLNAARTVLTRIRASSAGVQWVT